MSFAVKQPLQYCQESSINIRVGSENLNIGKFPRSTVKKSLVLMLVSMSESEGDNSTMRELHPFRFNFGEGMYWLYGFALPQWRLCWSWPGKCAATWLFEQRLFIGADLFGTQWVLIDEQVDSRTLCKKILFSVAESYTVSRCIYIPKVSECTKQTPHIAAACSL